MTVAAGRKALITGGASGFGLEIARRLCAAGARVALLDISTTRLKHAARELGRGTLSLAADVRAPQAVQEAVRRATDDFGGLDTLVISAGVIHIKPLDEVTEADWDMTLDVNLKGAFNAAQAAAAPLRESGRGRIRFDHQAGPT